MSARPPSECHVSIRGTMVSTHPLWPSALPVSVVQAWGMPGANGVVLCDGAVIHVRFDRDDQRVWAWAKRGDESECAIL